MNRAEQWLGMAAAACWLAAWFLPVVSGYAGWEAFRAALSGPFRESFPVAGNDAIAQVASALTNIAFVALWWRGPGGRLLRPSLFLKVSIICLVMNLYWPVEMLRAGEHHTLLVGFYVWLAAFVLLVAVAAISAASARRTSRTPTDGTPA